MQKWEYRIVDAKCSEHELNRLGSEGWELIVALEENGWTAKLVFKKRILD